MVRRFIGKQLFDVLPDGTSTPIIPLVPPRNILNPTLKEAVTTQDVIQNFLLSFIGVQVSLPGIVNPIPPIEPPSGVIITPVEPPLPGEPMPPGGPPPTPEPPPVYGPGIGVIQTRFGVPPSNVEMAIMNAWPQHLWVASAEVSHEESGWSNGATNDTRNRGNGQCGVRYFIESLGIWATTEFSIGLFQINICAHGGSESEWRDSDNNARKGYQLYVASGDFSPWAYTARRLGLPQHIL